MNLLVNLLFWSWTNFYVVFYYYFFPLLGIIIQFAAFFRQEKTHQGTLGLDLVYGTNGA